MEKSVDVFLQMQWTQGVEFPKSIQSNYFSVFNGCEKEIGEGCRGNDINKAANEIILI